MRFENNLQQNTGTGDLESLFEKHNPNSLREKLERKNFDVISEYTENGERITNLNIPNGNVLFIFGFQQIDVGEKRWFHGGSDSEIKYEKPFNFDINSTEFIRLKNLFISKLKQEDDLTLIIYKLEDVIREFVLSDMSYENSMSLSDIIKKRKAACASKSTLSGSILTESLKGLKIGIINGHLARLSDKVNMPFSHAWLRISDGKQCILYDPMYHKIENYLFDTPMDENMNFSNYTISAYPFATLQKIGLKKLLSGIKIVKSYDGKAHELKVVPELSLKSQLGGQMAGEVYIERGGILRLVNGNVETTISKNGPRLLYPLLDIEK